MQLRAITCAAKSNVNTVQVHELNNKNVHGIALFKHYIFAAPFRCALPRTKHAPVLNKLQINLILAMLQQLEYRDVDVRSRTVDGANCKYVDWRQSRDLAGTEMVWYEDRIPQGTPCGTESVCSYKRENVFKTYETFSECISL